MLQVNLETSIDNLAYIDYMQQQEQRERRQLQNKRTLGDFTTHTKGKRAIEKKLFPEHTPPLLLQWGLFCAAAASQLNYYFFVVCVGLLKAPTQHYFVVL